MPSGHRYVRHLVVGALCSAGALAAGSLLVEDLRRGAGKGTGEPAGLVEWQESSVRRKPPDTVVWSDVATEDPLYKKDSVRTGDRSGARLKLESGTVIELSENSLIVLEDTEDLSLNTLKGSMIVRGPAGDTKVTVDAAGKKTVEKLPVSLVSPARGARFLVDEGAEQEVAFEWQGAETEPLVLEVAGRRIPLEAGQTRWSGRLPAGRHRWRISSASADGKKPSPESVFEIEPVRRPRLVGPAPGESLEILDETGSAQFRWVPAGSGLSYRLEIHGPSEVTTGVNGASGFALVRDLREGDYTWKLVGELKDYRVESEARSFAIRRAEKLSVRLAAPEEDEVFEKRPSLRFAWHPAGLEKVNYRIRLRERGGERAIFEKETRSPVAVWEDVRPGAYEWEVTALSESGRTGGSGWRAFSVFEGDPIALTRPDDGADIRYWDETPEIRLGWKQDPLSREPGVKQRLEIASDLQFDRRVRTRDVASPSITVSELGLEPGSYYWRVALVDAQEKVIKQSAPRRFAFGPHEALAAPAPIEPAENHVFEQLDRARDPVLRWAASGDARLYRVRVIPRQGSARPVEHETRETSLALSGLGEGEYLWTVRAVDPLGREGQLSQARAFRMSWGDRLAAPALEPPPLDASGLRWSPVPNAQSYVIELKGPDGVARFAAEDPSWEVPEGAGAGYHSVKARARDRFGREGDWSAPADLVLRPDPVAPLEPKDGHEVSIFGDATSVGLSWTRRAGADRYRVEIFRGASLVTSRETRSTELRLPKLDPGEYRWKVHMIVASPEGRTWDIPAEDEWEFEVTRSLLAKPRGLSPEGEIARPPASSALVLEWEPVDGAEGYVVRIRRDEGGAILSSEWVRRRSPAAIPQSVAEKGEGSLQIVTRANRVEIDLPPSGTYTWQVRAVAAIRGADEYAHAGEISEAEFEFDDEILGGPAGSGYLALSTMLAPYEYRVVSPQAGVEGAVRSTALTLRLSGERIMNERWGLGVAIENTMFQINSQSFSRLQAEIQAKYRFEIEGGRYPWVIQPKAGIEGREYFQLTSPDLSSANLAHRSFWALGLGVGFDLRKQLSRRFSLGAKVGYFVPVNLVGIDGGASLRANASFRNWNAGLQGVYWLGGDWGLAAGAYAEARSISFRPNGSNGVEEVYSDGAYFYGSVIWRF